MNGTTTDLYTEILPNLYMGGTAEHQTIDSPQILQGIGTSADFNCVVTLFAWAAPANWGVEERRFGILDGPINNSQLSTIHELADWAHAKWISGAKVNIRCAAGLNRSGLVTAMILIKDGMTSDEAIELIRQKRSKWALFNDDFVSYLLSLDE